MGCRQPGPSSDAEKLRYVDEVLDILGLPDCADAIVGIPEEGA
jgi:hypothetical protein